MIQIKSVAAFNDNYIWLIIYENKVCVIDPGQKEPVLQFLTENQLHLNKILITHHHEDHTGGVADLVKTTKADVYASFHSKVKNVNVYVQEGDWIDLSPIPLKLRVLEVPGHTLDHIAFVGDIDGQSVIFCGDTLFSCGSGRIFEGNSRQMLQSLDKIKKIGENSLIFCAHEYTLSNIKWAQVVDPHNANLEAWKNQVEVLCSKGQATVPTSLSLELEVNPFLRVDAPEIRQAAESYAGRMLPTSEEVFAVLREWKNQF